MQRSTHRGQTLVASAVLVASIAALAVIAYGVSVAGDDPAGTPIPTPIVAPSDGPIATPTDAPSPSAPAEGPTTVELDIATDHDVSVVIDDETGAVIRAGSGRAGDGMSVRWFDADVENIDATTIRVTWVGLPVDEQIGLTVRASDGAVVLDFAQDAPPADSDAIGFDRVLVLEFDRPVDADDIEVSFPAPMPA